MFILAALFCATAVYIFLNLATGKKPEAGKTINTKVDSLNLHYLLFDKENRKGLEIWARECRKVRQDQLEKLLLKDVRALIFKKGRMNDDLTVESDEGTATPNFFEFEIRKNARIHSPRLSLEGAQFKLINMQILSTAQPATFRFEEVSGIARKGLDLFFKEKDMRIHFPEGKMIIGGKEYQHKEVEFTFLNDKRSIILDRVEYFKSSDSLLRAERFSIDLSDDLRHIKHSQTIKDSYLYDEYRGKDGILATREISADLSEAFYDAQGRLEYMDLRGPEAKVVFAKGRNRSEIRGPFIAMTFNAADGRLQKAEAATSFVEHQGKEKFRFFSQKMLMVMDDKADLKSFLGEFSCRLEWENIKGLAHSVFFQNKESFFVLSGEPARVEKEGNVFNSPEFVINTHSRLLTSKSGVQATIAPRQGKGAFLFEKPAYVSAQRMEMRELQNDLLFQQNVKLTQEETEVRCDKLRFLTQDKQQLLQAGGHAVFKLRGGEEKFLLEGGSIQVFAEARRVEVAGNGRLSKLSGAAEKLSGERIVIQFDRDDQIESISAWTRVQFTGNDVQGSCEQFNWNYAQGLAVFRQSAKITQKGITTDGEEIKVNLKENEIIGRPRRKDAGKTAALDFLADFDYDIN